MTLTKIASATAFSLSIIASHADTLNIALDISSSTPIVQPTFMRSTLPVLGEQIANLPIGSRVKVFSVGDDKSPALNIDLWVQRGTSTQGDTAKELANRVPKMIASYLNNLRSKPELMQGESSLSPAFLDASKWCQTAKPCKMYYLTDGMEYQPGVIAWPRDYTNPLPQIPSLDLKGMNVYMYGIGQGVPSQARIAIEGHWQTWLKKHGAGNVDLRRL